MKINFKNLQEIDKQSLIKLMNDLLVLRYMPLASSYFSEEDYTKFIQAKETMWEKYGFGPWAFELEGNLMGWGGLQFFNGEVEIAIVLYPKYQGYGKRLYLKIIEYAQSLKLDSIIILFPVNRKRIKGILKLGFIEDGVIDIEEKLFNRYRLNFKKQI